MAKFKQSLNAQLSWDLLTCEVVFDQVGVHLFTNLITDNTADLSTALSQVPKKSKAAPLVSHVLPNPSKGIDKLEAQVREWSVLKRIAYLPQIVEISRSRATQMVFFTKNSGWVFDPPGLFLDNPLEPTFGILGVPQIVDSGHTVITTFVPNYVITQFKYNLRLITNVYDQGAFAGHAIIIVDPIIETGKD